MWNVLRKVGGQICMGDHISVIDARVNWCIRASMMLWKTGPFISIYGLVGCLKMKMSVIAYLCLHPAFALTGPSCRFGTLVLRTVLGSGCPLHPNPTGLNY